MGRFGTVSIGLLWFAFVTEPARADEIDDARELVQRVELERARELLEQALGRQLQRGRLVVLLETRALLENAAGNELEVRRSLQQLAAIAPTHRFGIDAPPEVTQTFETLAVGAGLELSVRAREDLTGGLRLDVSLANDPGRLVRRLILHVERNGIWTSHESTDLQHVSVDAPRNARYYVEAFGPGGALVAHDGTQEEPHGQQPERSRRGLWIGIAAGGAVLLGAIIVGAAVARRPSGTQVNPPMFPER